jgi:hypothetical protein
VDIYYDIDAKAKTFDVGPIVICIPNQDSQRYQSADRVWNFASECRPVGTVNLVPTLASINIAKLCKSSVKGKRRCWLRLGVEVGLDIAFTVYWRGDGRKVNDDASFHTSKLVLELPFDGFVNEFRAPIEKRNSSDSNISNDILPAHLETLSAHDHSPQASIPVAPSSPGK